MSDPDSHYMIRIRNTVNNNNNIVEVGGGGGGLSRPNSLPGNGSQASPTNPAQGTDGRTDRQSG